MKMKQTILLKLNLHNSIWIDKYVNLVEERLNEPDLSGEFHHYFPTAIFGKNKDVVKVTVMEHCLLHWYLYKAYKECQHKDTTVWRAICFALTSFNMITDHRRLKTSELTETELLEYAKLNSAAIEESRELMREVIRIKAKERNADKEWYEKTYTAEWRARMSSAHKGKPKSEKQKEKMSISGKATPKPWVAEKINKNPEKIRKTAETHRGMKRSSSTKQKLSNKMQERIAKNGGKSLNKNMKVYYDPAYISSTIQCLPKDAPIGWVAGNPKMKGRKCYWDGINEDVVKRYIPGTEPNGWINGNPKNPNCKQKYDREKTNNH